MELHHIPPPQKKKLFGLPQNLHVCLISSIQLGKGERAKIDDTDDKLRQERPCLLMESGEHSPTPRHPPAEKLLRSGA